MKGPKGLGILALWGASATLVAITGGCPTDQPQPFTGDGEIAANINAALGEPMPSATAESLATFERGKAFMKKRFDRSEGLGPTFNLTSCGGCHEKPVNGGGASLYRNFFIGGRITGDGAFVFSDSQGPAGGVLRVFHYGEQPLRPPVPDTTTVFAQRKAIPLFGAGLLAEISDEEIMSRADPDDADGDGISGRANHDRGFVGRFGRKSQTVSIEGFIRGPLFNHLGVTTVPLSEEQRARLPVDSSAKQAIAALSRADTGGDPKFDFHSQAAAADAPNHDDDGVADPEMSSDDLFDIVSFVMLLAAPRFDEPTEQTLRGNKLLHDANCTSCHAPRLNGPRGPVPVYSDLLLHDMGPDLNDGIVMKEASGAEFRTQPLWGLAAAGPFLHDGRASTLRDAILMHGGEAQASRDAFAALSDADKADLIAFIESLGGKSQHSGGLLPPDAPVPAVGVYGGPMRALSADEMSRFVRGRSLYDRDFDFGQGAGAIHGPTDDGRFNGDSCRSCHSDPVIGGAGPRDVNVMRHGVVSSAGAFSSPSGLPNTILHKEIRIGHRIVSAAGDINCFEHRQTPHNFGLGLIDAIPDSAILANADPDDADGDGIRGRAHVLDDGRLGRLGWKAQVPSVAEFIRDAMAAEIGLTLPQQAGLTFGMTQDDDGVADPELSLPEAEDLAFFLSNLAPPPRQPDADSPDALIGRQVFEQVGCAKCHVPSLPSALGDVPLFSDLLLHDILAPGSLGIADGTAATTQFRTAPLWGLSQTAPYFHSGEADTVDQAIRLHDGEAKPVREAYELLDAAAQDALLAFLKSL